MKKWKIQLSKPWYSECELRRIEVVLKSSCWAGTCPWVEEYEKKFAATVGTKYAIAASSCTSALHAALLSVGVKQGDEVIVSDFSFPATALSVMYCQAKPVFADIKLDTFCVQPDSIREKITDKTKAIIPVNQFGMPCDIDEIIEIAEENDLRIVWDSATGLGSEYKKKKQGSFEDVECFSSFPTKNISTGEGGMITTNDEEIASVARSIIHFGKEKTKAGVKFTRVGYNYRLSAIQAAIGTCQLEKLPVFISERKKLVQYYKKRISEEFSHAATDKWLVPQHEPEDRTSAWQRFVCLTKHRDDIIVHMEKYGIECSDGNYAQHMIDFLNGDKCENSAFAFYHALSLPLYYGMTFEDVDYVIEALKDFFLSSPPFP